MTEVPVRRCRGCGEAKAISMRDWDGTVLFGLLKTGRVPRRDFVCQGCGAGFSIEPWRLKLFSGLAFASGFGSMAAVSGLLGLGALLDGNLLGLAAFGLAVPLTAGGIALAVGGVRPLWLTMSRPVVDGAPVPDLRYGVLEPVRRCTCGRAVACSGVTDNRSNGVHTGMEWAYLCPSCGRQFTIESAWGQVFTAIASTVAVGLGALMLSTASGQGAGAWACAGSVALLGVFGYALSAFRLVAGFRFPVVSQSELVGEASAELG